MRQRKWRDVPGGNADYGLYAASELTGETFSIDIEDPRTNSDRTYGPNLRYLESLIDRESGNNTKRASEIAPCVAFTRAPSF